MESLTATAKDGVKIPITILYRKGTLRDGSAPCLLYGYGSYGIPQNVIFNSTRFSLVDRGMVYALAHIRGGGELGETWHEAGRMKNKMNTFTDFIACAEELIRQKIARKDGLIIQGGSAGGLLMGAVTNLRPDLFKGVLAQVPFVDVLNTMLDESLPLTVGELRNGAIPRTPSSTAWMRGLLALRQHPRDPLPEHAGAHQPERQPGELLGAGQVRRATARAQDRFQPAAVPLQHGRGHGGASGRYDALHDLAFDYVWMLGTVGLTAEAPVP